MRERWRVVSVSDAYEVSDLGRVRRIESGRISNCRPRRNGYISVALVLRRSWAAA